MSLSASEMLLLVARDVAAAVVMLFCLLLARAAWLRRAYARRHPYVMTVTLLVSALVGLSLAERVMEANVVLADPQTTVLRTVIWFAAVAAVTILAINAARQHRMIMGTLRRVSDELEATAEASAKALGGERQRVYERIADAFRQMIHDTSASTVATAQLQQLADGVLRPLSRDLVANTEQFVSVSAPTKPQLTLRERLDALVKRPLINPKLLSAAVLVLTFRQTLAATSSELTPVTQPAFDRPGQAGLSVSADWDSIFQSIVTLVLVSASVYVTALVLSRIFGRVLPTVTPKARWVMSMAAIVVISASALGALSVVNQLPNVEDAIPPFTAQALFGIGVPLAALMVVGSVIQALFRLLSDTEASIETYNHALRQHVARTNAQLTHERRSIARTVHNTVQASVNAARLTLDRINEPDPAVFAAVTGRIADAVEQLRADQPAAGLAAQLDGLGALWAGVCAVSVELEDQAGSRLDADAVIASLAGDIIYEACANAVVHGRANTIEVAVTFDDAADGVTVTVTDNGTLGRAVTPGTGSQILASVCTHWELTSGKNGTVLSATLPLARYEG